MGKAKTVITENGAVYQLSNPKGERLFYKIVGVFLIVAGVVLTLALPLAGVLFALAGLALVFWLPKKIQQKKTFLSFSGSPCAGCHTFGHWDPKVHAGQPQLERFEKAAHQPMAVLSYNSENGFAEIRGSGSDSYMTSLDECSCPDFDKRGRPCKHIYFLAIQMGYTSDDFYSC